MSAKRRILLFLRRNWGAVFVLLFIGTLFGSAADLSLGLSNSANQLALYGFYFLVLGILLEILSSVAYRNTGQFPDSTDVARKIESSRRFKVILSVSIASVLLVSGAFYPSLISSTAGALGSTTVTARTSLAASLFFVKVIPEPDNQTLVTFEVLASGGASPYTYLAVWSDGFTQSNDVCMSMCVFSRMIQSGSLLPKYATVTVTDAKGKNYTLVADIPIENVLTSTTVAALSEHSIIFVEKGLPPSFSWSVNLNGTTDVSSSNTVLFSDIMNGNYNYTVSYLFNGSFNSAYSFSPRTGVINLNSSNVIQNITFVPLATNQIVTPSGPPSVSYSNGSDVLKIPYMNNLPANISVTILVAINNTSGQFVTATTGSFDLIANSNSSREILLPALPGGNYSLTVYAVVSNGVIISPESTLTFSVS